MCVGPFDLVKKRGRAHGPAVELNINQRIEAFLKNLWPQYTSINEAGRTSPWLSRTLTNANASKLSYNHNTPESTRPGVRTHGWAEHQPTHRSLPYLRPQHTWINEAGRTHPWLSRTSTNASKPSLPTTTIHLKQTTYDVMEEANRNYDGLPMESRWEFRLTVLFAARTTQASVIGRYLEWHRENCWTLCWYYSPT